MFINFTCSSCGDVERVSTPTILGAYRELGYQFGWDIQTDPVGKPISALCPHCQAERAEWMADAQEAVGRCAVAIM